MRWGKKYFPIPPNKGSGSTKISCFWGMGARTSLKYQSKAKKSLLIHTFSFRDWFSYLKATELSFLLILKMTGSVLLQPEKSLSLVSNISSLCRGRSAARRCWTGAGAGLLCHPTSIQEHGHSHLQIIVACFKHVFSNALCGS